jgi:hypothetical protein
LDRAAFCGVEKTLRILTLLPSIVTQSVNVPPVSTPMRMEELFVGKHVARKDRSL